jgi:hypothetical protein
MDDDEKFLAEYEQLCLKHKKYINRCCYPECSWWEIVDATCDGEIKTHIEIVKEG